MLVEYRSSKSWVLAMTRDNQYHGSVLHFDPEGEKLICYEYFENGRKIRGGDIYENAKVDLTDTLLTDRFTALYPNKDGQRMAESYYQGRRDGDQYAFTDDSVVIEHHTDGGRLSKIKWVNYGCTYQVSFDDEEHFDLEYDAYNQLSRRYDYATGMVTIYKAGEVVNTYPLGYKKDIE